MWLLVVAAFGFLVPNGFFIHWLLTGDKSLGAVLGNELALGFILDCALTMVLLAWLFAVRPIGRVRWPWFVVLSFAGGLGFSIPLYLWLNRRSSGDPKASFGAWWRGAGVVVLVAAGVAAAAGSARAAEPVAGAWKMYRSLKALGKTVELYVYPRGGHLMYERVLQREVMGKNLEWFPHLRAQLP